MSKQPQEDIKATFVLKACMHQGKLVEATDIAEDLNCIVILTSGLDQY